MLLSRLVEMVLEWCQPSVVVVTEQLVIAADGKEKSLSREDGRSMIGWNAAHPCFILTRISKKFLALWTKEGEL
jgi:hypothetical protein